MGGEVYFVRVWAGRDDSWFEFLYSARRGKKKQNMILSQDNKQLTENSTLYPYKLATSKNPFKSPHLWNSNSSKYNHV